MIHFSCNMMTTELKKWAGEYVLKFNKLSEDFGKAYYTQSPLDNLTKPVELMIVGINPAGDDGVTCLDADSFLRGNALWDSRFSADGKIEWPFISKTHSLLGYRNDVRCEMIDDDSKTVWTNLTPFASPKGSSDIPGKLMKAGVEALLKLIAIIKPRKIVLLGVDAFKILDRYSKAESSEKFTIDHLPVIDNIKLEIGRIEAIPAVQIVHPAGKWPISNKFTSIFLYMHSLCEIVQDGVPVYRLQQVRETMQKELKAWVSRIVVVDDRLIKVR